MPTDTPDQPDDGPRGKIPLADAQARIEWLQDRVHQCVWLGISSRRKAVHGHGYWVIKAWQRAAHGMFFLLRNFQTNKEHTVQVDNILHWAEVEPDSKVCDFKREWDEGLSRPPTVPDFLPETVG